MPVTSKPGSKKTTPHSDVIDYDEHLTGERKEGAYFATTRPPL